MKPRLSQIAQTGAADGDVATWDEAAGQWVPQAPSGGSTASGELLMTDGVSSPPVPVTTEDGTDWLYEG